jgi:hypothetical protein
MRGQDLAGSSSVREDRIRGHHFSHAAHMFTKKRAQLSMRPFYFLRTGNRYRTIAQRPDAIFQSPRHNIK